MYVIFFVLLNETDFSTFSRMTCTTYIQKQKKNTFIIFTIENVILQFNLIQLLTVECVI